MQAKQLVSSKPKEHPIGQKPLTLRDGSVSVKIYGTWSHSKITDPSSGKKIKNYIPEFTLRYYLGSNKQQQRFTDLRKAKLHAKSVLTKIRNNETEALKLTGLDRSAYVEAKSILSKVDGSPSLVAAIQEYAAAKRMLEDSRTSLEQIAKDYVRRSRAIERQVSVAELVEELIAVKEKSNLSDDYIRTLRRLRRFGKDFQINAHELNFPLLQEYLDSMLDRRGNPTTPRTKRNYWKLINTLIQFGVKRKCISNEMLDQVRGVDLPKDNPSEITIWKPSEFAEMLNAARPELVPTLALGGFAGIRTAEINRLDWADLDLGGKMVKVAASKAKTRSRRIVPLCDAAIAWLKPYSARTGKVAYYAETNKYAAAVMSDVRTARELQGYFTEPEWRKNALRHSYISYRLADTQNAHRVAIEAGNSETIIFKNYRELVTEEEARVWFSILPTGEKNIIPISNAI
jgi:integrase